MNSQKSDHFYACPHCGAQNAAVADAWLECLDHKKKTVCASCREELNPCGASDVARGGKSDRQYFSIKFFMTAAVLVGLFVYLNRTFDVFRFKDDSGQIIYEALLVLFVSATIGFKITNLARLEGGSRIVILRRPITQSKFFIVKPISPPENSGPK